MTEHEAAAFLGVTPRTLLNYRKAGRLSYRPVKGKTRPQVEYDQADLERLKADLTARAQSVKPKASPSLRRVSFGLSPHDYAELSGEAKKYGMKPGEYARRLMRESLESNLKGELEDLRAQDSKGQAELKRLRADVSGAFELLLEFLNLSPQAAQEWVTENLR